MGEQGEIDKITPDMANRVSIKGISNDINVYSGVWQRYDSVAMRRDSLLKQTQVHNLCYTGLTEGPSGGEVTFLPLASLFEKERSILKSYDQIRVEDHEVELCNEIYYTSKLEGANTTIARTMELHDGAAVDHNNYFSEMMIKGGFEATKFLNLHGNKIDFLILRQMWERLTDGCCDNADIAGTMFRTGDVYVGRHMGFSPVLIEDAMADWIDYYTSDIMSDHPFIKSAILHAIYEKIHPFCDGNGRSGRLLMINYLISQGYDKCKAVSFSRQIANDRAGYDEAFNLSENVYCDCTAFVDYMLDVYDITFYDILESQKNLQKGCQDSIKDELIRKDDDDHYDYIVKDNLSEIHMDDEDSYDRY